MFTIYSADVTCNPGNCSYPHKHVILDEDSLKAAICHDYVCAEYKNSYRNGDNFIGSDCLPVDCDNDNSENPEDWITPEDVLRAFPGVTFAVHYSRFNNRVKNGKPARPKFHVLFPIDYVTDAAFYSNMKKLVNSIFPYFDTKALDAARFFFGTTAADVALYPGRMNLTEYLNEEITKICLKISNTGTFGQFRNYLYICTTNQFFFQIQNLRQKNDFQPSTVSSKKFQIFLRFNVLDRSVLNTKTTVVPD